MSVFNVRTDLFIYFGCVNLNVCVWKKTVIFIKCVFTSPRNGNLFVIVLRSFQVGYFDSYFFPTSLILVQNCSTKSSQMHGWRWWCWDYSKRWRVYFSSLFALFHLKFHFGVFSVVKFIISLKCLHFVGWQRQICIESMSTSGWIQLEYWSHSHTKREKKNVQ